MLLLCWLHDSSSKSGGCLQEVAQQAEGYDAADLRVLVDRALHAAARRQLSNPLPGPLPSIPATTPSLAGKSGLTVSAADLADARQGFQPAAAWGVGQLQVSPPFLYSTCFGALLCLLVTECASLCQC